MKRLSQKLQPLLFGCLTGIICGAVIALFLVCARVVANFAVAVYSLPHTLLAITCTTILVILCCLITAVIQILVPSAKGSGIPLGEAAARGMLGVKWLRSAAALIAGSILAFLSGMPLGSEGPSIGVGGMIGEGVGRLAKKPIQLRRYLITGGSSAGLAVAFNAPLTGVAFALEETHRRFTPSILLAAFSAVVPAVMVAQLMYWGFSQSAYLNGLGVRPGMAALPFLEQADYTSVASLFAVCAVAVISGIICSLFAAAFNRCIFVLSKLFGKINNAFLRLAPAFLLTVVCGLCMHNIIGSGEMTFEHVSVGTAAGMLVLLIALRFVMTVTASGVGATGGLFLPMIAIGGITGTLIAKLAVLCGMSESFAPNIIMLTISAFFAATTFAPISAVIMCVELTASFANLLPCAVAVAIATAVSGLLRTNPLYEHMMENLYKQSVKVGEHVTVCGTIAKSSFVCDRRIRDVLWPYNSLVTALSRGETEIVPDGETVLHEGDNLTIRAENVDKTEFTAQIQDYITIEHRNRIS